MGILQEFYVKRSESHLYNPRDPEHEKKWTNVGLLEGLNMEDRWIVAFYFEMLLQYLYDNHDLVKNYNKTLNTTDDTFATIEVHLFPIIRRLFGTNKLNSAYFLQGREHASYLSEITEFIDGNPVMPDEDQMFVDAIREFIPAFIEDYITWRELPQTLDTRIILANAIDPEAELVAWYADCFILERVLSKIPK